MRRQKLKLWLFLALVLLALLLLAAGGMIVRLAAAAVTTIQSLPRGMRERRPDPLV